MNYNVIFRTELDSMVYETDVNSFKENTGLTIQNVSFPILEDNCYYIELAKTSKTFSCGNVIDNLFIELKKNDLNNVLLIIDFEGVEEISKSFYYSYTKILLETSNKIITINMNTEISNQFSAFILSEVIDVEE